MGPGIRDKVMHLEATLNKQNIILENQTKEIKRLHRMLDPLRLSLQSYTDQSESRIIRLQEKMLAEQREKNNQLTDELNDLKSWKAQMESMVQSFENQIKTVSSQLTQFNNELFGEEH